MSKQVEVLIEGQPKNVAPSKAQVNEALKGHKVVSVLQVSARPSKGGWLVVAEVEESKKRAAKPKAEAKPKAAAKPKKSLIGSDSE
tara:strand:- start:4752 stop:5009 length:258 start_codon:yes stop_codon:yes gene_type:complete